MAEITPIGAAKRRRPGGAGPFARRLARLEARLLHARAPVVWVCAGAGSGKTRLLEAVRAELVERRWSVLDDPPAADLERALEAATDTRLGSRRRLLLASRPRSASAALLLRSRCYGRVETLGEAELFVLAADATPAEAGLLAATGGWPWLLDAALAGREAAARALLPEFLEREVLAQLPEGLVAALFAAASMTLAPGALERLGAESQPLLASDAAGTRIAATWVREALLALRGSATVRAPGVRARLLAYYASLADPGSAIEALLAAGESAAAIELFRRAGGAFYGYRHGYHALERALGSFGPELEQRSEEIYLARLWMLVKTGRSREAALRLEARHPGLPVDLRRLRVSYRPELLLLRVDMSLELDGTPPREVIASWARLQGFMAPGDDLAHGMVYNSMAIGYLQADALVEARQLAQEALACYERARNPYLVHFMHVHLADIALRQSRLEEAAAHVARAAQALAASGQAFNSEQAIIASLGSRVAFEQGRFEDCASDIEPLLGALAGGDSWPDLIPRVAEQVVLAVYWRRGLRSALEQLDRCTLAQSRRHGEIGARRLALLRIRLLQAARRHAEAGMLLEEHDLDHDRASETRPSAALAVETDLVRLRHALAEDSSRAERVRLVAAISQHPALETRQRISLALLEAAGQQRAGAESPARRHLRVALREAEAQGLIAVLIEEGECLERLLPAFVAAPGPGNGRLADFAARVLKQLQALPAAPVHSKQLAGLSRQEHRVLSYVADGYSNKETARALSLSESTVKFHLRNVFAKLGVRSRAALGEAARARGVVT